jgi:hypothetical protein
MVSAFDGGGARPRRGPLSKGKQNMNKNVNTSHTDMSLGMGQGGGAAQGSKHTGKWSNVRSVRKACFEEPGGSSKLSAQSDRIRMPRERMGCL